MSYTFKTRPCATIKAKISGTDGEVVNVQGTNPDTTPDNAKAQIDKILALTGTKTVSVAGMTQTITKEAFGND